MPTTREVMDALEALESAHRKLLAAERSNRCGTVPVEALQQPREDLFRCYSTLTRLRESAEQFPVNA